MENNNFYLSFKKWLDEQLIHLNLSVAVAYNFNLYDDGNNKWSIEFVGTSEFDENDSDWACSEIFATRENPYSIVYNGTYIKVFELFKSCVLMYLDDGKYSEQLKSKKGIGIGFVDGDLELIEY